MRRHIDACKLNGGTGVCISFTAGSKVNKSILGIGVASMSGFSGTSVALQVRCQ